MADSKYIDSRWAWYAVTLLFLAYTCSFIDRTILALLVEPVKRDLHLSDTQVSLLHGLAFALFYTFMGVPISRLADHHSRRLIIGTGIVIWSLMTAVCGLTKTFWQLFAARVGVGIGEAALSPAAYSLISDCFPREKLGRALAFYSSGVYVGAGLAFIIGGAVIQLLAEVSVVNIPGFGTIASWQSAFFIVGLPGIALAILIFYTLPEPERHTDKLHSSDDGKIPFKEILSFVKTNWRVYASHYLGFPMGAVVFGLVMAWAPTFFIRAHGLTASETGYYLGIIIIAMGSAGAMTGGWLGDKLQANGHQDSMFKVGAFASLMSCPLAALAPIMPNMTSSLCCYGLLIFTINMAYSTGPTALQLCTPNRMRAQVSSLFLFFLNVFAIGLAPTAAALMTDHVFRDEMKLGLSLATVGGFSAAVSAVSLWWGRKHYAELVEKTG